MEAPDDELMRLEATGATPLPLTGELGYIENDGARLWYSAFGAGAPVILLHGGIPGAALILLNGVSHFAPLQRPGVLNTAMLAFVEDVLPAGD
jgi:pimeloyl-ACP methyl ester carboxylesterase